MLSGDPAYAPPLIERVDSPDPTLGENLVLVRRYVKLQRQQMANGHD